MANDTFVVVFDVVVKNDNVECKPYMCSERIKLFFIRLLPMIIAFKLNDENEVSEWEESEKSQVKNVITNYTSYYCNIIKANNYDKTVCFRQCFFLCVYSMDYLRFFFSVQDCIVWLVELHADLTNFSISLPTSITIDYFSNFHCLLINSGIILHIRINQTPSKLITTYDRLTANRKIKSKRTKN